ncbi:hypothetical protein A4X13_0g2744 [Tilletia indica]|uniref:Uncharacterized protein n=1 Tax=Tilletia indica TaxID=43049 RepID=A0A177TA79_9BASI|nr:hypothetical protein A4X13_0g2744 [Tilletia indica]
MTSEGGSDADPLDLFEDALLTIFDERMPAAGDPGQRISFSHPALPTPASSISYHIPNVHARSTHLFAHHQWDSGVLLARIIAESSSSASPSGSDEDQQEYGYPAADIRGQTVVELGAGTGLPGLVAGLLGAKRVLITDYDDLPLIDTIKSNIASVCPKHEKMCGMGLTWGSDDHVRRALSAFGEEDGRSGFSRVLAADTLWVSSAHDVLLRTMRSLLSHTPDARILMLAGFHTGRPAISRFFQLAAGELASTDGDNKSQQATSEGILVPDWEDPKYGGIWERRIDGQTRAWQGVRPRAWTRTSEASDKSQPANDTTIAEHDEEMGEISERAKWIVCASLRWSHLQ